MPEPPTPVNTTMGSTAAPQRRCRRRTEVHYTTDHAFDLGTPVLLPGGEVGIITAWWHADDHTEWRWQLELYNRVGEAPLPRPHTRKRVPGYPRGEGDPTLILFHAAFGEGARSAE